MLKDGKCFTTNSPKSLTSYEKGDILEISEDFIADMEKSGTCHIASAPAPEKVETPTEPVFDINKANLASLVEKAASMGIDPTINGKPKTKAQLKNDILKEEPVDEDEEIDLDALDRKGLIELVNANESLKSVEITDEMDDDAVRDAIADVYAQIVTDDKATNPVTETK